VAATFHPYNGRQQQQQDLAERKSRAMQIWKNKHILSSSKRNKRRRKYTHKTLMDFRLSGSKESFMAFCMYISRRAKPKVVIIMCVCVCVYNTWTCYMHRKFKREKNHQWILCCGWNMARWHERRMAFLHLYPQSQFFFRVHVRECFEKRRWLDGPGIDKKNLWFTSLFWLGLDALE
jgi:hypothetical protein